jgi:hypothetical protein
VEEVNRIEPVTVERVTGNTKAKRIAVRKAKKHQKSNN